MEAALLKGFPVVVEIPVEWGDMDAFRHVNNVVYFRYFQSARIAYFDRIGIWEFMEKTGIGLKISSVQAKYLTSLTYPDVVSIGTRVSGTNPNGFTMQCSVFSHRHSRIAAEGEAEIVTYNYRNYQNIPLPAKLKQKIHDIEAELK
ncbi:MAG: acyl-CoA thioesterase [Syntrophobacteraceae bacterium]